MKIGSVVYKKLLAQAEEAKDQGFTKIADGILGAIGACPDEDGELYSHSQMQEDISNDMWKIATRVIRYYDIDSVDAIKLEKVLGSLASELADELEEALGVDKVIANKNDKVPGQY